MPKTLQELLNKHHNYCLCLESIKFLIEVYKQDWLIETYFILKQKTIESGREYYKHIYNIEVDYEEIIIDNLEN